MADKDPHETRRHRLESVIPDLIKRAVELGVEKATEAPDNIKEFVGGIKLPKEIAAYILTQVDETKNGLYRVVAKEVRDFLESTNISSEMKKVLTTLEFQVQTTIRFKPAAAGRAGAEGASDDKSTKLTVKPEVKTDVQVKRDDGTSAARERTRERRRNKE